MIEHKPCPRCDGEGTIRSFSAPRFDRRGSHIPHVLEVPCPNCGARMDAVRSDSGDRKWDCYICQSTRGLDTDRLLDRMTGEFESAAGYDRPAMTKCPICGDSSSVMCGADGERYCDECGEFHAGRFSTEWWAYAAWLAGKINVEVRSP